MTHRAASAGRRFRFDAVAVPQAGLDNPETAAKAPRKIAAADR
jgi:hypothetical protein